LTELQYLHILRRPGTARLLLPTLAARIPDSIAATAITVLVHSVTGSYPLAGLAAGGFGIGTAISVPLTGRALDRLGQRRMLPALAAAFAAVLVAMAVTGAHAGAGTLAALAVAAGLCRPPTDAALRAMWPRLVRRDEVAAAYALDSTAQELIWISGPLLLAALLATGSTRVPLLACAAATAAGTAMYSMALRGVPAGRDTAGSAVSPLRSGRFRALLVPAACYGAAGGMLNLGFVAFAAAHGGVAWVGVLVAIWSAGSLAGGLAYGTRNWRAEVEGRAVTCLALFGATLALLAAAPDLAVMAVLMIPLGLPLSPWLGALSASVQRAVPAAGSAEGFAWTFAVIKISMAAGSASGGVIIQAAGARAGFLVAGGLALAGAGLGALWLPVRGAASVPVTTLFARVRALRHATLTACSARRRSPRSSRRGSSPSAARCPATCCGHARRRYGPRSRRAACGATTRPPGGSRWCASPAPIPRRSPRPAPSRPCGRRSTS